MEKPDRDKLHIWTGDEYHDGPMADFEGKALDGVPDRAGVIDTLLFRVRLPGGDTIVVESITDCDGPVVTLELPPGCRAETCQRYPGGAKRKPPFTGQT